MEITFREWDGDEKYLSPTVDGKEHSCFFDSKGKALVYAGLVECGMSSNDASYLARYISYSVDGILKDK